MKRYFAIYKECIKAAVSKAAAYRLNFLLSSIITLIWNILFPFVTILIYRSGASFPGWDFYEVLLIQSIYTISSGIASILLDGVLWVTMEHVKEGNFEIVLLKPVHPLFYLIASTFDPNCIGLIIGGGVMFGISVSHTGVVSMLALAQFLLLFLAGTAVMTGISLIMAAISFKWIGNSRIPEIFESIKTFGKYPLTIFPKTLQYLAMFLVPVGMIGFFPASALLGRINAFTFLAVFPCFLFMAAGIWLYQHMLKLYEGVGG